MTNENPVPFQETLKVLGKYND